MHIGTFPFSLTNQSIKTNHLGVPPRVRLSAAIFLPCALKTQCNKRISASILNAVLQVLVVLILSFLSLHGFLALQFIHSYLSTNAQAVPVGCQVATTAPFFGSPDASLHTCHLWCREGARRADKVGGFKRGFSIHNKFT